MNSAFDAVDNDSHCPEDANRSQPGTRSMYVCLCHGVTDHEIRRAAESGVRTVSELTMRTGLGSGCGSCVSMAVGLIDEVHAREFPLPVFAAAA
jgi:bacterioferritin-associated ferredoxin